jgi:hypothetical protein
MLNDTFFHPGKILSQGERIGIFHMYSWALMNLH